MKTSILALTAAVLMGLSARADDVTLSKVHLCCGSCVTGAEKAVGQVNGAKAKVDKDAGTIQLTGDKAAIQKAVDALIEAGYFGKSSDDSIKVNSDTGAKGAKVQSVTITGLHLCCAKCASAVDKVALAVPGVKAQTAKKDAKSFEVTGDFNDKDLMTALQNAGLTGKITK